MLTGLPATAADAPAAWKAGVATAVITPQQAMWMAGYANRTNVSQGKFDDLHAKVLALEDERGGRMVFVTLDLIGIPRTMRKSLEARVEKAWQLPAGGLLLNASHTHSGESPYRHLSLRDREYPTANCADGLSAKPFRTSMNSPLLYCAPNRRLAPPPEMVPPVAFFNTSAGPPPA